MFAQKNTFTLNVLTLGSITIKLKEHLQIKNITLWRINNCRKELNRPSAHFQLDSKIVQFYTFLN